uniref:Transmembrane protein 14C n=2 Tax=Hemiselmis andersenii TaxID=464988 RepID=A0A6U2EXH3_HEMAN
MSLTMGVLMTAGGAYAFFKKGSKASLIGGAGTGALFFLSAGLLNAGQNRNGHMVALASSVALVAGMAPRAYASKKFMPAGLVATLGLLSSAYQGKKTIEWWGES